MKTPYTKHYKRLRIQSFASQASDSYCSDEPFRAAGSHIHVNPARQLKFVQPLELSPFFYYCIL